MLCFQSQITPDRYNNENKWVRWYDRKRWEICDVKYMCANSYIVISEINRLQRWSLGMDK